MTSAAVLFPDGDVDPRQLRPLFSDQTGTHLAVLRAQRSP